MRPPFSPHRKSRTRLLVLFLVHAVHADLDDARVPVERREPHTRVVYRRGLGALVRAGVLALGGGYTGAAGYALGLEGRVRQPAPELVALYAIALQAAEVAAPMAAAVPEGPNAAT